MPRVWEDNSLYDVIKVSTVDGHPLSSTIVVNGRAPTTTSVSSSTSSVLLLAANTNRKGISIVNDSTAVLRLSFTSPATNSNAFMVLQPKQFLILDQQLIITNAIYGIWESVNGTAQITEYV